MVSHATTRAASAAPVILPPPPPLAARVEAEISRLMHAQDPPAIVTNFAAVLLIAWLHRATPERSVLLAWVAAWLVCNGIYLGFYLVERRLRHREPHWQHSRRLHLVVATFISVLPAGFMPWLFSPTPAALYLNITLVVIYCSGVFASNTMLSATAFIVGGATILAPVAVLLFTQDFLGGAGIGLGLALVMYFLFMIPFSLSQSRAIRRAIQTGFENETLAQQLAQQTARADAARQVAERERTLAEAARAEAEEANRAKARFLAAATHDLRQPLHALSLTLASLRMQAASAEAEPLIARADDCTRHLSAMFDALLDQARLDAGTIELRLEPIALAALLAQIESQFLPLARSRGLWLRCRPTTTVLLSDRTALWRIASNLVTNALAATRSGGVLIAWRGGAQCLEVRDSGRGIAIEDQARIFDEFHRLPAPDDPADRGLGLGLSTVRRLAGLLGGQVSVRSAPGKGSVFRVSFDGAQVLGQIEAAVEACLHHGDLRIPAVPGLRVLAVDDDAVIRASLATLLAQWGYEVRLAASAADAMSQIENGWRPQVLLLDRHLPDASGLELGTRLRARLQPAPACLIVTGDTAPEDFRAMLASGFEVLHKPVAPEVLRAALGQLR